MAWIYLIIAAACETAWTFSLKLMKFNDLKKLNGSTAFNLSVSLPIILPFAGYIVFGIINVYFFSQAVKQLSMAMAFAVWTAISLTFIKMAEMFFLKQSISLPEALFILLIMIGIAGLKYYAPAH